MVKREIIIADVVKRRCFERIGSEMSNSHLSVLMLLVVSCCINFILGYLVSHRLLLEPPARDG